MLKFYKNLKLFDQKDRMHLGTLHAAFIRNCWQRLRNIFIYSNFRRGGVYPFNVATSEIWRDLWFFGAEIRDFLNQIPRNYSKGWRIKRKSKLGFSHTAWNVHALFRTRSHKYWLKKQERKWQQPALKISTRVDCRKPCHKENYKNKTFFFF